MDKKNLNPEELTELKKYIKSRSLSFKEPGILAEILDHFACKTEEIWNEQPSLSFHEAMQKAHESFGVRGFAPIASAWEANTHRHYKLWHRKIAGKILLSVHGLGILALSLLMANLYWVMASKDIFPANGFEFLTAIELAGIAFFLSNRTGRALRRRHPMLYGIATQSGMFGNTGLFLIIPFIAFNNHAPTLFQTAVIGLTTFLVSFYCLIQSKLHNEITAEIMHTETLL